MKCLFWISFQRLHHVRVKTAAAAEGFALEQVLQVLEEVFAAAYRLENGGGKNYERRQKSRQGATSSAFVRTLGKKYFRRLCTCDDPALTPHQFVIFYI